MNFIDLIREHLPSGHERVLILGQEGPDPLDTIVPNLCYVFPDKVPDLSHTIDLIRTSTCFGLLRIGQNLDPVETFKYFYGLVSESGLIVVDRPSFQAPPTIGTTQLVYRDDRRTVWRREPVEQTIRFAIVMASYHRAAGTSRGFVERAIKSIGRQTYQRFKLFLIGDKYQPEEEFESFRQLLPEDQIELLNLPVAWERDHCTTRQGLWCVGGATAMNRGMDLAVQQGFTHYVHLDDDDYWHPFHLRNMAMGYTQFPEASFVCTMGTTNGQWILPKIHGLGYNNFKCAARSIFHSAYGFRLDIHPFRYITYVPGQPEPRMPADALMLDLIGTSSRHCLAVPLLTCLHDFEATPDAKLFSATQLLTELIDEMKRSRSHLRWPDYHHLLYDLRTTMGPEPKKYGQIGGYDIAPILSAHPYQTELADREFDLLFIGRPGTPKQLQQQLASSKIRPGCIVVVDHYITSFITEATPGFEVSESIPNIFKVTSLIVDEYDLGLLRKLQ